MFVAITSQLANQIVDRFSIIVASKKELNLFSVIFVSFSAAQKYELIDKRSFSAKAKPGNLK